MGNLQREYSFYLAGRPKFLIEFGRIFDFFGIFNTYNRSKNETDADIKAIYLDWAATEQDLKNAMSEYESTKP